jgi:3-oxoacyl-[acyl-carrier-protein] synthase II
MGQRRVVISGMGWVTPLGTGLEEVWQRLLRGDCAIGPVTRFDAATFGTNFAAEVKQFALDRYLSNAGRLEGAGLNSKFALAAASMAWKQAGLDQGGFDRSRMGIYMGAGEGPMDFDNFAYTNIAGWDGEKKSVNDQAWAKAALARLSAKLELEQEPNQVLTHMAREFGCRGPAFNCMTACAASTQAIGEAFEMIRRGDADLMFAGGSHSMIHPLGMTGFVRLTAMSTRRDDPMHASRPFDISRDGFVMGEGAGVLVLESLESARARGATPLAEVAGFGSSADAFRITDIQPDGRGAIATMTQACRQAGIDPREPGEDGRPRVHYISAHGTGTQENDKIETVAVKGVFGALAPKVPFSSVKSMLGHLIQAAGAVELMTCVMAIQSGWAPPTLNLDNPDPECDLDYVPNKARDLRPSGGIDVCLSNSFGFGGQNNTLCVRRFR